MDYPLDASQVKVKGLEKKDVHSGEPVEFEIDVTGTKDAPITASVPPSMFVFHSFCITSTSLILYSAAF